MITSAKSIQYQKKRYKSPAVRIKFLADELRRLFRNLIISNSEPDAHTR
jgi:hypothetical protein